MTDLTCFQELSDPLEANILSRANLFTENFIISILWYTDAYLVNTILPKSKQILEIQKFKHCYYHALIQSPP